MTITIIVFLLGICIGSFLNVCIYRMPAGESIVTPRSHCPKCNQMIAWYDNLPLLSYLILRGKCRHCKEPFSARYFMVELLTGICFLLIHWVFKSNPIAFFIYAMVTAGLIVITFIDIDHLIIPDEITLSGIVIGLLVSVVLTFFPYIGGDFVIEKPTILTLWAGPYIPIVNSLIGAAFGGGILLLIAVIAKAILKKEAMGGGDIKLLAMAGAFMGWQLVLLTLMIASLIGSIIGSIQLILIRKEDKETALTGHYIPFGPYLAFAAFVCILWGNMIIDWYLNLLTGGMVPPTNGGMMP
jgi:leader peptidase (prepilin peptidase)/N-methyltransferase